MTIITMAATGLNTIPAFSICKAIPRRLSFQFLRLQSSPASVRYHAYSANNWSIFRILPRTTKIRSFVPAAAEVVAEGESDSAAPQEAGDEASTTSVADQTVSVTVSPSDVLTMFFQAEGTINETAIPTVTQALEETEGITDLRVQVLEGIASVELTKQTTVQATGVASTFVEIIQSKGFKLQTLNLSFQDEEDLS